LHARCLPSLNPSTAKGNKANNFAFMLICVKPRNRPIWLHNLVMSDDFYMAVSKSYLELNSKKRRTRVMQNFFVCVFIFLFSLNAKLQVLKFEFCQKK